ncbi:MAG TPA: flagellar filament capping protein FliD [Fontimonas sp.]
MASISSAGIGSGLEVSSLVTQLISAERQNADTRLAAAETKVNAQISALGTFRAVMAGLQTAAADLKSSGALSKLTATSGKTELFGASVGSGAVAGKYSVEVVALAQPHKLVSATYASADTVLGNGDVEFTVGGQSFTVTLSDGENSLAALRDKINADEDNVGVVATLVKDNGSTRLLLTSAATGTASAISVNSSLASFTEKQAAQDAHVRVEGYDHYSSSNSVSGVIDGLTLNLVKAEPGTVASLDIASDSKTATTAIETFVRAYNTAIAAISTLTRYDPVKKEGAALAGDALARGAAQEIRGIIGSTVSGGGAFGYLSEIGITTATDGTLKIDSSKLAAAMNDDRSSVQKLFGATDGYATRLGATLDRVLGTDGRVATRDTALKAQLTRIDKQQEALDERMARMTLRYRAQFSALDTLMSKMNATSSYLTQQLAALTNNNS